MRRQSETVVRVLPDVAAIDKPFDYLVPADWADDGRAADLRPGTMVRIDLHGRRVAAWVLEVDVEPPAEVDLKPLAKLSGLGPPGEVIELAGWAAWRWSGRTSKLLRVASPPRMVHRLPPPVAAAPVAGGPPTGLAPAFERPITVVRHPPDAPISEPALEAARRGPTLVAASSVDAAKRISGDLRRAGAEVALLPRDWAAAAAGGRSVVGGRNAVWAPMPDVTSIVVVDEHDEAHKDERTPTWHARDVAVERARRLGVPCVLVSPAPSLDALVLGPLMKPPRAVERASWPVLTIVDRRDEDPTRSSMLTDRVVPLVRELPTVVCVLNRRGRARLLACGNCGELARCGDHDVPLRLDDTVLRCPVDGDERPVVCSRCGSTALKNIRAGVTRVREDLEALARRPVVALDGPAGTDTVPAEGLMIGTEAALHRVDRADAVIFLDVDQELLAPRFRAAEQAFILLVRAARLLGGREAGGRLVLQTRQPAHPVVDAALHGDPGRLAHAEAARRRTLHQPPFSAQALLSGSAAGELAEALAARIDLTVRGPLDGGWLVRAPDHTVLCDALAETPRPRGRLRVEVDPLRA